MAILGNMRVNGRALRALRTDRNVSLRQCAQTAGISAPYLSRIETEQRGTSWVSPATVAALAAALSLPIEAITAATEDAA